MPLSLTFFFFTGFPVSSREQKGLMFSSKDSWAPGSLVALHLVCLPGRGKRAASGWAKPGLLAELTPTPPLCRTAEDVDAACTLMTWVFMSPPAPPLNRVAQPQDERASSFWLALWLAA